MANLELEVPQQVKNFFGGAFLSRGWRGARKKHEVEITVRRHLAAAGAAEADERESLTEARPMCRSQMKSQQGRTI